MDRAMLILQRRPVRHKVLVAPVCGTAAGLQPNTSAGGHAPLDGLSDPALKVGVDGPGLVLLEVAKNVLPNDGGSRQRGGRPLRTG